MANCATAGAPTGQWMREATAKSAKSARKSHHNQRKKMKNDVKVQRKYLKICEIREKVVTLHPLFGVTAVVWAEVLPGHVALERQTIFNFIQKMDLIKVAEEAFATGKKFPEFKAGDTITVAYKIVEGTKERIQLYRGVVIKISGHGDKKRFTVRKMSGTVGVERIFPIESPAIDSIEVNKHGKVRRAKLYYLRKLTGKKARIAEKKTIAKSAE